MRPNFGATNLPYQLHVSQDPDYGRLLVQAAAAGVRFVAAVCDLDTGSGAVEFKGTVPLQLLYKHKHIKT